MAFICATHTGTAADLNNLRDQVLHRLQARTPVTAEIVTEVVFEVSAFIGASMDHEADVHAEMVERFGVDHE